MRNLYLATTAALLALSPPALASTDVACWNRALERVDYYVNPPERGDNDFFTAQSNRTETTNVALLYPAKKSMRYFMRRMYRIRQSGANCDNTYLNGLTYFMPTDVTPPAAAPGLAGTYSKNKVYPDPGPTYAGGGGQSDGLVTGKTYRFGLWPANDTGTPEDVDIACNIAADSNSKQTCKTCVAEKGYWLNPDVPANDMSPSAGVFRTNWLRFHPPKWTLMSLAYKRLVNGPLLSVLRESVVATNDATGGKVIQKMLPQSCRGQGRPLQQKQNAIDSLSYTSTANPLAEMMFNTAWYMGGQESDWWYSPLPGNAMRDGDSTPCDGCGNDFMIIFSDGRGDTANTTCMAYADGGVPAHCTAAAQCNTLGMGIEGDGNDFLDPSISGGPGTDLTGASVRIQAGDTCDFDFADDVAYWMRNNSVSKSSSRRNVKITTYVVALGEEDSLYGELDALKAIADLGGPSLTSQNLPKYAHNFRSLETSIEEVMKTIIDNATSQSAAAIPSVQTRGYTSAFIPRFRPGDGPQWAGSLTRFQLFNEFSSGCTSADYGQRTANNPNGNSSCYDIYLRDNNGDFVGEDDKGNFVLLDTSRPWDGGWPLRTGPDGGGTVPATPVWEAAAKLTQRADGLIAAATDGGPGTTYQPRTIFTAKPGSTPGTYTRLDFTVNNAGDIKDLLKLGGVNGELCQTLAGFTRNSYANETECAEDVIRFVHGEDVLRKSKDNRAVPQPTYLKSRPNILGDIFHSTPVLVTPPVAPFLCDLGIANQCVASLYSPGLTPGGNDAYAEYVTVNQHRAQFVLVAANDGMLHAFNAGNYQASTDGGVSNFDLGTGEEMWAFIPPDILPKLIRYAIGERHELLVDGTPMVRDIWVDGSGATSATSAADGRKQKEEFHTVAILGEREGGRSYFALDVTDPWNPKFLWSAPPPGSTEGLSQGESWNDLGPAAPPIGPIAEKATNGPFSVNSVQARERYVVAVGGGYDSAYLRGRSISVLDAWTGQQVFRFSRMDTSDDQDPRYNLGPVAAPVSLLDANSDGLFDTAVVGDTLGQVWALSMSSPGEDTTSDGRYDNWFGGRAFAQFKGDTYAKRSPFFQRAVAAVLPTGEVRIFLGSGDRDNIKDPNGGTCGLANLTSCLRRGCDVAVTATRYGVGTHSATGSWSVGSTSTDPTASFSFDTGGQSASCTDVANVSLGFNITCGSTSAAYTSAAYCDWGATDAGVECPVSTGRPLNAKVNDTRTNLTFAQSRFYSFKLFDLTGNRARFSTAQGARDYDTHPLTETDLADVTSSTATLASSGGNGWLVKHTFSTDEKTASSALLLGGCVLWNTLNPNPNNALQCNDTLPSDTAYLYQADAITGAISCGTAGASTYGATTRATPRNTHIAPQQPSPVISVNSTTGEIVYSGVSIEPGSAPVSVTVGAGEILGPIHWLEVPRKTHDCRHDGTNCN